MPRLAVAALAALLAPSPSRAFFHESEIDEIMLGVGADATAQYVEIRTTYPAQTISAHSRLVAFGCDGTMASVLLEVPGNVCNGATGARWSMGTAAFASATGVTPDFTFAPATLPACGMICWGGGGGRVVAPENPPTWDITDLSNYIDCVAYGSYTGPTKPTSGTPSTLPPGNGAMSLTRIGNANGNATDFALAAPSPGSQGCPVTTTTSSTSTTTTLPDDTGHTPPGKDVKKCEDAVAKNVSKLIACVIQCHMKAIDAAFKLKTFDEEACEETDTTKSCRAKYDKAATKLAGSGLCPACLDLPAQKALADGATAMLDSTNGQIYCASPGGAPVD